MPTMKPTRRDHGRLPAAGLTLLIAASCSPGQTSEPLDFRAVDLDPPSPILHPDIPDPPLPPFNPDGPPLPPPDPDAPCLPLQWRDCNGVCCGPGVWQDETLESGMLVTRLSPGTNAMWWRSGDEQTGYVRGVFTNFGFRVNQGGAYVETVVRGVVRDPQATGGEGDVQIPETAIGISWRRSVANRWTGWGPPCAREVNLVASGWGEEYVSAKIACQGAGAENRVASIASGDVHGTSLGNARGAFVMRPIRAAMAQRVDGDGLRVDIDGDLNSVPPETLDHQLDAGPGLVNAIGFVPPSVQRHNVPLPEARQLEGGEMTGLLVHGSAAYVILPDAAAYSACTSIEYIVTTGSALTAEGTGSVGPSTTSAVEGRAISRSFIWISR